MAIDPNALAGTAPLHPEMELEELKHRAVKGALALLLRDGVARIAGIAGGIALARILTPEVFGIFAVVTFVVMVANFFRDVGLGAALVQRGEPPGEAEFRTVFTVQLVLVGALVALVFAVAPVLAAAYGLEDSVTWLIRVSALSLLMSALGTVPSIKLERKLEFDRLVMVEIPTTVAFQVVAVGMALAGFGVWSLVGGSLARAALGLVLIYAVSPWTPRLGLDRASLSSMLSFGVPFQLSGLITLVKDNVTPTFVAAVAGAQAVGYIGWAANAAYMPLTLVAIAGRVSFPAYSRLQDKTEVLKAAIERSIRIISMLLFPIVALWMALAPQIVHYVYTDKWMPALPAFYLFCASTVTASVSTTLVNALYALGRSDSVLKLNVIWMILAWGLGVPLVLWLGYEGIPLSSALISVTVVLTVREMDRHIRISILPNVLPSLAAASIAGIAAYLLLGPMIDGLIGLGLAAVGGGFVYLASILVLDRSAVTAELTYARRFLLGTGRS